MKAPCKDCPDRYLGCHSKCEKYLAYDAFRKEIREKRSKANKENSDWWATAYRRKKR